MKEFIASGVIIVLVSAFTAGDTAAITIKENKPLPQVLTTEQIIQKTDLYKRTEMLEKTMDSLGYAE